MNHQENCKKQNKKCQLFTCEQFVKEAGRGKKEEGTFAAGQQAFRPGRRKTLPFPAGGQGADGPRAMDLAPFSGRSGGTGIFGKIPLDAVVSLYKPACLLYNAG